MVSSLKDSLDSTDVTISQLLLLTHYHLFIPSVLLKCVSHLITEGKKGDKMSLFSELSIKV